jgi:hypothetical protein
MHFTGLSAMLRPGLVNSRTFGVASYIATMFKSFDRKLPRVKTLARRILEAAHIAEFSALLYGCSCRSHGRGSHGTRSLIGRGLQILSVAYKSSPGQTAQYDKTFSCIW